MTYFPTLLPVQFYGLPDGKVHVIYARFYEIQYDRTYQEFVFAEHTEFSYDYDSERIIPHDKELKKGPVYNEIIDKPNPKIKINKIYRNLHSYAEAFNELNKKAQMMHKNKKEQSDQRINGKENNQDNITAAG